MNLQTVKDKAPPILKKHKVKKAAVFGSVAKDTATYIPREIQKLEFGKAGAQNLDQA